MIGWAYDQQDALHYCEIIRCEHRYISRCSVGNRLDRNRVRKHPAVNRLEPRYSVAMDGLPAKVLPRQLFLVMRERENIAGLAGGGGGNASDN
jgi:hypothetical protein